MLAAAPGSCPDLWAPGFEQRMALGTVCGGEGAIAPQPPTLALSTHTFPRSPHRAPGPPGPSGCSQAQDGQGPRGQTQTWHLTVSTARSPLAAPASRPGPSPGGRQSQLPCAPPPRGWGVSLPWGLGDPSDLPAGHKQNQTPEENTGHKYTKLLRVLVSGSWAWRWL